MPKPLIQPLEPVKGGRSRVNAGKASYPEGWGGTPSTDGAIWVTSPWKQSCLGYIGLAEFGVRLVHSARQHSNWDTIGLTLGMCFHVVFGSSGS